MVREFLACCHGIPRTGHARLAAADVKAAAEWWKAYGLEKARWMIGQCASMQRKRAAPKSLRFRGLHYYENGAAGAYEEVRSKERLTQERTRAEDEDALWTRYVTTLVRLHDPRASHEELQALSSVIMADLQAEMPDKPSHILAAHLRARVWAAKLDRMKRAAQG